MTDRFANGVPPTTPAATPPATRSSRLPAHRQGFYHGGDLAGLMAKLDYLDGLGRHRRSG
jgi:glycosidase